MKERLRDFLFGGELNFREKIFRLIVVVGSVIAFFGLVESLLLMMSVLTNVLMVILLVTLIMAGQLTYFKKKIKTAIVMVGTVLVGLVFPGIFISFGGIEGGASVWFVLGIVYVFMMYSGRTLAVFVVWTVLIDIGTYLVAYHYPQIVQSVGTRRAIYVDSAFAVVVVAISVGILIKYHERLFEEEQAIAKKKTEELEESEKSRDQFFTTVSHEIRTPINTIMGLDELILRDESLSKESAENAVNIQNAGKMLLALVNDILDISQMEQHRMEILTVTYGTRELVESLVNMIRVQMAEKQLDFIVDVDENLPSALKGDERRIRQVLLNLLNNAVKYTKEGNVRLIVRSEQTENDCVRLTITVSDTGIGIRKKDMDSLFEMFRRVDQESNRKVEGSGLGLAICKRLVSLMGGQISVDSIYSKGSQFTVVLEQPIADATPIGDVDFVASEHSGVRLYRQSFEAPEARVLMVDDNTMNLMVVQKLLKPTRVQFDMAESGAAALECTKKKFYQVILMDHRMPGMDGPQTLEEIRRQENGLCRETPVIAMTGNMIEGGEEAYEKMGFQGYLEKPITGERLEETILSLLPEELIEYRAATSAARKYKGMLRTSSAKRLKKICITTDCICDMSPELLARLDVRAMYLYITTFHGRFCDTKEITSDNLEEYVSDSYSCAYPDSATVAEFEEFFAQMRSEAEEIIHISMAEKSGKTYSIACQAARGFGHVHVIDSGQISGGQALVVMEAVRLLKEGCDVAQICDGIERYKRKVRSYFVLPSADIFYQRGYTNKFTMQLFSRFNLHPVLHMNQSVLCIYSFAIGDLERCWKRYIRHMFVGKRKRIDTSLVYVAQVGLSVRQIRFLQTAIKKAVPFEKILVEKASVSSACNSGIGTIGIAFARK